MGQLPVGAALPVVGSRGSRCLLAALAATTFFLVYLTSVQAATDLRPLASTRSFAPQALFGRSLALVLDGSAYRNAVSADAPVADWELDEASGTTAADASGNGYGATYNGSFTHPTGPLIGVTNTSAGLNGSSSVGFSIPANSLNTTSGTANTVEFWMNWNGTQTEMAFDFNAGSYGYDVFLNSGAIGFNTGNGDLYGSSSSGLASGWHLIDAVFNNGSTSANALYVDGVKQTLSGTSGSATLNTTGGNVVGRISGWNYNSSYGFTGSIDEVSIFKGQLSDSQVLAHYNAAPAQSAPVNTVAPSVSGSVHVGQTLTATTGTWAGSGLSYAYQWQRCTTTSYSSGILADGPLGYWRLGEASGSTAASAAGPSGSYVGSLVYGQSGAISGDSDTAMKFTGGYMKVTNNSSIQPTGALTLEAWIKRSGTGTGPMLEYGTTGATAVHFWNYPNPGDLYVNFLDSGGGSHTLTASNVVPATGVWYYIDATYDGSTARIYVNGSQVASGAVGSFTLKTAGQDFAIAARPYGGYATTWSGGTVDEAAVYGSALSATQVSSHYSGGGLSCANIAGATGQSYTVAAADVSQQLRVQVTATNSAGSASAVSAATSPVPTLAVPSNTALPAITGTTTEAATLSASTGSWTNNPTSFAYQWQDCNGSGTNCLSIVGATASTYTLQGSDVGKTVAVQVTATNADGSGSATSTATGVVVPLPPQVVSAPTVVGIASHGDYLSTDGGVWKSSAGPTLGYQWQVCQAGSCTDESGATQNTYTPTSTETTFHFRVVVTATNAGGSTTATSPQSGDDYSSLVMASNPVGYWRLNETGPSALADYTGHGYTGVGPSTGYGTAGAPAVGTDTALNLSNGDIASVPYAAALNPNGAFSVEVWLKTPTPPSSQEYQRVVSTCHNGFRLELNYALNYMPTIGFYVTTTTGYRYVQMESAISADEWHHVVGVFDGGSANPTLYVDGVEQEGLRVGDDSSGPYVPTASDPLTFGQCTTDPPSIASNPDAYSGVVDEVAVYNHALTADEVVEHYSVGGLPPGSGDTGWDPSGDEPAPPNTDPNPSDPLPDTADTNGGYNEILAPPGVFPLQPPAKASTRRVQSATRTATVTISRADIVQYTNEYHGKLGTASHSGYDLSYPTFSGTDCQNFVSQALRAGGWTDDYPLYGQNATDSRQWFFGPSQANFSITWSAVFPFMRYVVAHPARATFLTSLAGIQQGDVMMFDWDGLQHGLVPHHSMVVTAAGSTVSSIKLAGHTNNRFNYPLTTILKSFPAVKIWVIHLSDSY
jgi:hypothetical protein